MINDATRMLSLSLKIAYLAVSRNVLLKAMALTLSCNRLLLHLSPIRKTPSLRAITVKAVCKKRVGVGHSFSCYVRIALTLAEIKTAPTAGVRKIPYE